MAPSTSSISNTFHILKQEGYRVTDCNSISHPQLLFLCLTNSSFSLIAYMLGKPNKNFDFYNYFILIADYFLHKNKSKITLIKCKDFFSPRTKKLFFNREKLFRLASLACIFYYTGETHFKTS